MSRVWQVHARRQVQMHAAGKKGKQRERETHHEAHQVELGPGEGPVDRGKRSQQRHTDSPLLLRVRDTGREGTSGAAASGVPGLSTCSKRSAKLGVSRIAPSSTTHLPEF